MDQKHGNSDGRFIFLDEVVLAGKIRQRLTTDGMVRKDGELEREVAIETTRRAEFAAAAIKTFPARHRCNIRLAVGADSPWRDKLDTLVPHVGNGSIFAFLGDRGTGKTQLATAAARYVSETRGMGDCRYAVLGDLLTEIKATFKPDSDRSEASALRPYQQTGFLVLDELHEITATDWAGRILTLLVDYRYREQIGTTILIANLAPQAFLAAVGPSIASRLDESGFVVSFDWPSFRGVRP